MSVRNISLGLFAVAFRSKRNARNVLPAVSDLTRPTFKLFKSVLKVYSGF